MTRITPLHNHILFRFEDTLKNQNGIRGFSKTTDWGFELGMTPDDSTKSPRWGLVVEVGIDVSDNIQPGSRILIEPLRWTTGIKINDKEYWRTDSKSVIGIYGQ